MLTVIVELHWTFDGSEYFDVRTWKFGDVIVCEVCPDPTVLQVDCKHTS